MVSPQPVRRSHTRSTSLASISSLRPQPKTVQHFIIPLIILSGIVLASASQTEVAHHLTTTLEYHQPYFTFYLSHISFVLAFPIHLGILRLTRRDVPTRAYLDGLRHVIADQLGIPQPHDSWRALAPRWSTKVVLLTLLVSVPALSWYIAMNLTTGLSVTTIYASSSFWAYFFSMLLLKQPLSTLTLASITLAFAGVIILSLGSIGGGEGEDGKGAPSPLLGDTIMMFGAVILGLYEVVYKMALPEGHGGVSKHDHAHESTGYSSLPTHSGSAVGVVTPPESRSTTPPPPPSSRLYDSRRDIPLAARHIVIDRQTSSTPLLRLQGLHPPSPPPSDHTPRPSSPAVPASRPRSRPPSYDDADAENDLDAADDLDAPGSGFQKFHEEPFTLPAALHANFLTSCIGLATVLLLWIPIPILHWIGWESFRWPGEGGGSALEIWTELELVALGGAIYNAGLMVLIGIWGPTTSSVANLLTIGLVAMVEAVWLGVVPNLETWIGVGMICVGFGLMLWEGEE